tara:strand:- start:88426 stop:88899 length:474 start_codon:yes stop_codon:yes gene_type:complete
MDTIYLLKRFDAARFIGSKINVEERNDWHPYFRPWRWDVSGYFTVVKTLLSPQAIVLDDSSYLKILCYPFFANKTGRFISLDEFYSDEPVLCVDSERADGVPESYLYDCSDLYRIELSDGKLCAEKVDQGKYASLIDWMTKHVPWHVNPGVKLSLGH